MRGCKFINVVAYQASEIVAFLGRAASTLGRHGRDFSGKEGRYYLKFFLWDDTAIMEIYLKTTFSRFYQFILPHAKFLDLFFPIFSIWGNRLIPFNRSTQILPIPMVFGVLKNPDRSQQIGQKICRLQFVSNVWSRRHTLGLCWHTSPWATIPCHTPGALHTSLYAVLVHIYCFVPCILLSVLLHSNVEMVHTLLYSK